MKTALIIGFGEVGETIFNILRDNLIDIHWDIKHWDIKNFMEKGEKEPVIENLDFLHICIPFKQRANFVNKTVNYIKKYTPKLTIIHSTVEVGTTQEIILKTKKKNVVHSPVKGVHRSKEEMLIQVRDTLNKWVGAEMPRYAEMASEHLTEAGFKNVKVMVDTKSTELAKLVSTTWYGVNIAYMQEVERWCKKHNVKFEDVLTKFNIDGYFDPDHTMPRPHKMFPGVIGGHCVMQNLELLLEEGNSRDNFLSWIKRSNEAKRMSEM